MKNADEIQAKVTFATPCAVSYTKLDNPNGPVYKVSKNGIFYIKIKYENGIKDVFKASQNRQ